MVIDKLTNIGKYRPMLPHLDAALVCLKNVQGKEPGRYDFDGGFILIQAGTTNPIDAGAFEVHRKYLDVQILLSGAETIMWADLADLNVTTFPYDETLDRSNHAGTGCRMEIQPGMFYLCAPHDAHKACGHVSTPTAFRKAVVKLRIAD